MLKTIAIIMEEILLSSARGVPIREVECVFRIKQPNKWMEDTIRVMLI